MWEWAQKYEDPETVSKILANPEMLSFIDIPHIVFMKKGYGMLFERTGVLEGTYVFNITMIFSEIPTPPPGFHVKAVFTGAAYGLMGTDARGRDLAVGIVFGSRLALIIGLLTAVLSTVVGVLYGIVSAYLGGWRDELLQRIQETVSSIPVLPLLIILAFVMRPTVWILALLLVVFGWVGPVKTVRSIAYQIKEETYVEAARAVGCSSRRIIAKYISPQILPYMFALIALGVPGAILTEAGISFLLGVEGVSEPTWGRILHDAQAAGATMAGMWWWVLIPGFMITLSGLAFVLIGNALDRILNPMLKR
ncbi:ABC transporter permease [archaeon]|nr:ABC transporter permease [archaeon]